MWRIIITKPSFRIVRVLVYKEFIVIKFPVG